MPDGIQVDIDQLPKISRGWDHNALEMAQISRESLDLKYSDLVGMFSAFVDSYNAVAAEVGRVCGQGGTQMTAIAEGLLTSYNRYIGAEAENILLTQRL